MKQEDCTVDGSKMISWHISRIHNFHGIFDSASVSASS